MAYLEVPESDRRSGPHSSALRTTEPRPALLARGQRPLAAEEGEAGPVAPTGLLGVRAGPGGAIPGEHRDPRSRPGTHTSG